MASNMVQSLEGGLCHVWICNGKSQELRPEQQGALPGLLLRHLPGHWGAEFLASRLALNYDMVFLALLLSSLYEPAEEQSSGRCLIHPLSPPAPAAERGHTLRSGYECGPGLLQRRRPLAR